MDALHLVSIPDKCFNLIIDKGLMDSQLCSKNNIDDVTTLVREMYRVLAPGTSTRQFHRFRRCYWKLEKSVLFIVPLVWWFWFTTIIDITTNTLSITLSLSPLVRLSMYTLSFYLHFSIICWSTPSLALSVSLTNTRTRSLSLSLQCIGGTYLIISHGGPGARLRYLFPPSDSLTAASYGLEWTVDYLPMRK